MKMLIDDKIYKRIKIFDYQGVCFKQDKKGDANSASFLFTVSTYLIVKYIYLDIF